MIHANHLHPFALLHSTQAKKDWSAECAGTHASKQFLDETKVCVGKFP
jgi:hypothetical protein